jgi:hypothetical protein
MSITGAFSNPERKKSMLKESDLDQFTGTENHFIHPLSGYKYTDGVQYVAEQGQAYWLLDKILITMRHEKVFKKEAYQEFTTWTLTVNEDKSVILEAGDGNGHNIYKEEIKWTTFPINKVEFWFEYGVLILPSEH